MRKAAYTLLVLYFILSVTLGITLQSYAQALPSGSFVENYSDVTGGKSNQVFYKLTFLGYSVNPDLTVTFYYKIKAYDKPINSWALYSKIFIKGALVSTSESVVYKPSIHCLKFVRVVSPHEERVVTFTLRTGYYTSFKISKIDYYVRIGYKYFYGHIQGPTPRHWW